MPDVANGSPPWLPLRLTANAFVVGVIQGEFQQCAVSAALAAAAACAAHTAACMPHASIARVLKRRCFHSNTAPNGGIACVRVRGMDPLTHRPPRSTRCSRPPTVFDSKNRHTLAAWQGLTRENRGAKLFWGILSAANNTRPGNGVVAVFPFRS